MLEESHMELAIIAGPTPYGEHIAMEPSDAIEATIAANNALENADQEAMYLELLDFGIPATDIESIGLERQSVREARQADERAFRDGERAVARASREAHEINKSTWAKEQAARDQAYRDATSEAQAESSRLATLNFAAHESLATAVNTAVEAAALAKAKVDARTPIVAPIPTVAPSAVVIATETPPDTSVSGLSAKLSSLLSSITKKD